jgi:cytochrome b6
MDLIDALHLREPWEALKAKTVPRHGSSIWYYMGGLALFFLCIQIVTGIFLMLYYRPVPESAHDSIQLLITKVPFGELIRSVHAWASNALIALVFIHMFSAFFMRSYRSPRAVLWVTGIVLLLIMLGFGFTGYLLPWDQTSYFATRIGTEIPRAIPIVGDWVASWLRGSKEVTGSTLTRLFALHVAVLPMIAIAFATTHVAITALAGSSVPSGAKIKSTIRFIPNYIMGEAILWLIGLAVLLAVAVLYPWPLGIGYDLLKPTEPPAGVHPEWYFMFLFQSLKYIPEWAVVSFYTLVLVFWMLVPWLDRRSRSGGKNPIFTIIGIVCIAGMAVLTALAYISVDQEITTARMEQGSVSISSNAHSSSGISIDTVTKATNNPAKQHPGSIDTTTWLFLSLAAIAFLILVLILVRSAISKRQST